MGTEMFAVHIIVSNLDLHGKFPNVVLKTFAESTH